MLNNFGSICDIIEAAVGRTLPFTEAEAELKAGPDEVLARFGRALAEEFSLREEPRSKIQRAMALAEK